MLTIRLQRIGKKNSPTYRFIISEKGRDTQGKCLEILGNYNAHDKDNAVKVDAERVKYWLGAGAQMSNTVNNLLLKAGLVTGKKQKSVYISKTRAAKLAEKKKAEAPKEAPAAEPALAPAAPEQKPAEETKLAAEEPAKPAEPEQTPAAPTETPAQPA